MRLDELHAPSAEEIAKQIQSECRDFVAAYKEANKVLYRGIGDMQGRQDVLVVDKIRTDRKPQATPEKNHEFISQALDELKLPTRKNTIASSPRRQVAAEWGPTFVLFVKDGWTGLTFEKSDFDDLYVQSEVVLNKHGDIDAMKAAIQKMRPVKITTAHELAKAIQENHHEIIFSGSKYFALNVRSPQTQEILRMMQLTT